MAGASVAIVPFAVFGTAAAAFLIEAIKSHRNKKKRFIIKQIINKIILHL